VLSLDADYLITGRLQQAIAWATEQANGGDSPGLAGYRIPFRYCVFGKPLSGTVLPPESPCFAVKPATTWTMAMPTNCVSRAVAES